MPSNVVNLGDRELRFGQVSDPIWIAPLKDDYGPIITGDGLTLIYQSPMAGGLGNMDLYAVTRPSLDSTNWSAPVNLGTNINSAFLDEGAIMSPDGLSLYFDSPKPGGIGGTDLYVSTRPDISSSFGPALNLGPTVNSTASEGGAYVSADNLNMVFTSDRSGSLGPLDVWMCSRTNASAPWERAVHLPAPINAAGSFTFPLALSGDGLTMFLKSDRPNDFGLQPAGAYVTRRHSTSEPFGPPVLIQPILATAGVDQVNGVDLGAISNDGKTLWIDTFLKQYPEWERVVQLSIEELPRLEAGGFNSAGEYQVILNGREGATYEVQISKDLQSWTNWVTTNTTDTVILSDSAPKTHQGQGYYRVLSH